MWEKVKLKEICKLVTGKTPPTKNAEYFGEDLMWLTPGDFNEKFIQKSERGVTTFALKDRKINLIPSNSLFITCIGNIGKLTISKVDACSNQQITALCPFSKDVNIEFLYYYLQTIQKHLSSIANNAVVPIINNGILGEIEIPLPPLPIQEKIATILDKADELRRKDKDLQAKYDELAQAIFIDMFGDPVQNEKGFKLGTIRDLVREVKYGTSQPAQENGMYPYLRMNNITYGGYWDFSSIKYINANDSDYLKYGLEYGDLIFNRTNSKDLVGKTAIYRNHDRVIIAGYLIRVRVNNFAHPDYISGYLNSKHGKLTLQNMCKNIVGQANINAQELQDIKILIPPLHLQEAFAKKIELINQLKAQTNAQKSEELFQSLLQKAFKGELVS